MMAKNKGTEQLATEENMSASGDATRITDYYEPYIDFSDCGYGYGGLQQ